MSETPDRETLLAREADAWAALTSAIDAVPPDRRAEAGVVPDWSTLDLVWHCAKWAEVVVERYDEMAAGAYDPTPRPDSYWRDLNDRWGAESKSIEWSVAHEALIAARERAREAFIAIPEVTNDAAEEFVDETIDHFREHAAEIARFAGS